MSPAPQTSSEKKIQMAALIMMVSIMLSRVIGFVREWALARTVGATQMTDVYSASFTIPDFVNHLMAAGALSISFVPLMTDFIARKQKELGNQVFQSIATGMGTLLIVIILLSMLFAKPLALLVAPGFSNEQTELLADLLRIILPAQFFFYWGGLAIAVQYAHGRFLFPALAPVIYNAGIIGVGVGFHRTLGIKSFSLGVLIGSLFSHGLIQWWGIKKLGYRTAPSFNFSPEIKKHIRHYFWLTLPIMLGFSLVVADEWLSKYFGSTLGPKAISWLHYARIEMRIPIAVIGGAAGIASFPFLSRLWSEQKYDEYAATLLRQIQKLWAAAPLAAIFLFDHAVPLTHAIFGGTKFTTEDFESTARALQMFSLGVFFWSVQLILARGFYACKKTWLPSIVGTLICVLCIPLYAYLARTMNFEGLALASSIGIGAYALILGILLRGHLKKYAPNYSFRSFNVFCLAWTLVIFLALGISHGVRLLNIYQSTQMSALSHVTVALAALVLLGWGTLRTLFKPLTDGEPLY